MGIKGTKKQVELMGYTLKMESFVGVFVGEQETIQFLFNINDLKAEAENRFAPYMSVNQKGGMYSRSNQYQVQIQTTAYGTQTIVDYRRFMEASQKAYLVAKEFQKEVDEFVKNETKKWMG